VDQNDVQAAKIFTFVSDQCCRKENFMNNKTRSNNLFNFPESYERLENIVKSYPADKFNLLEAHTMAHISIQIQTIDTLRIRTYPSG
jgi:hypothetical protein